MNLDLLYKPVSLIQRSKFFKLREMIRGKAQHLFLSFARMRALHNMPTPPIPVEHICPVSPLVFVGVAAHFVAPGLFYGDVRRNGYRRFPFYHDATEVEFEAQSQKTFPQISG